MVVWAAECTDLRFGENSSPRESAGFLFEVILDLNGYIYERTTSMQSALLALFAIVAFSAAPSAQNHKQPASRVSAPSVDGLSSLDKVYSDETHCLTSADMRGDRDLSISCWCRDAIVEARYVFFNYVSIESGPKDPNLKGIFLRLEGNIPQNCGPEYQQKTDGVARVKDWRWNGPEVVRTYPSDEAVSRIKPEPYTKGGKSVGRWVPFTIQLVYKDAHGLILRTENYSSREYIPDFSRAEKPRK